MSQDNRIGVFLAGLGLGAIAGILLAPGSGAEIRKKIRSGVGEAGDYLQDRANEMMGRVDSAVEEGKAAASDLKTKSKAVAHEVGRSMEHHGKRLQDL